MDRKAAKELAHIQGWLERVDEIVKRGMDVYLTDALIQEAGDSLMMKLGEAANRLAKLGVLYQMASSGPWPWPTVTSSSTSTTRSTAISPGRPCRAICRDGTSRSRL